MATDTASKMALPILGLFLLVAVMLFVFSKDPTTFSDLFKYNTLIGRSISIHGVRVVVDVADTKESRQRGLSGREGLPDGKGLLMVFDTSAMPGIWMKDMNFPIDAVWINANWTVVDVTPDLQPESYPKVFYPQDSARYILEVPAGFTDIYNVKIGDSVEH